MNPEQEHQYIPKILTDFIASGEESPEDASVDDLSDFPVGIDVSELASHPDAEYLKSASITGAVAYFRDNRASLYLLPLLPEDVQEEVYLELYPIREAWPDY